MNAYFSYGSNMNNQRMLSRGLDIISSEAATLRDCRLLFNKRSRFTADESRANITFQQGGRVEGVLYQLACHSEIGKLDPFEGTPRYYSREVMPLETEQGLKDGWVYMANPGVLADNLKPPRWYLNHLLAGRRFLSVEYLSLLNAFECHEERVEEVSGVNK